MKYIVTNKNGVTKQVSESVAKNAMILKMSGYTLVGEVTEPEPAPVLTPKPKEKRLNLQEKSINK